MPKPLWLNIVMPHDFERVVLGDAPSAVGTWMCEVPVTLNLMFFLARYGSLGVSMQQLELRFCSYGHRHPCCHRHLVGDARRKLTAGVYPLPTAFVPPGSFQFTDIRRFYLLPDRAGGSSVSLQCSQCLGACFPWKTGWRDLAGGPFYPPRGGGCFCTAARRARA